MDRRVFIPNSVTAANIVVGFVSMLAAADGRFKLAVYLLVVAVLLDAADGRLARHFNVTSKFGQEMDSLSDSLSFCAAPAFLVHQAILQDMQGVGVAITVAYVLAGVFRLARFNLTSDLHEKASFTTGVPTPVGAGYLLVLVLMRDRIPVPAAATVVVVVAMLMLSRVHLPEMKGRGLVALVFGIGFLSFFAILFAPNWYTVVWWNVWNVVILLVARRAALQSDDEVELNEIAP